MYRLGSTIWPRRKSCPNGNVRNELIAEGLGNRLGGGEGGRGAVVIRSVCYRKGSNKRGLYMYLSPLL